MVLYCIVLYCIALYYCIASYDIAFYCIVLYCIASHDIALHCIALYCIVLYCIVLYCVVLHCIVLCCVVLHCIVLYCIVLCCIILYCIASHDIVLYCIVEMYLIGLGRRWMVNWTMSVLDHLVCTGVTQIGKSTTGMKLQTGSPRPNCITLTVPSTSPTPPVCHDILNHVTWLFLVYRCNSDREVYYRDETTNR